MRKKLMAFFGCPVPYPHTKHLDVFNKDDVLECAVHVQGSPTHQTVQPLAPRPIATRWKRKNQMPEC